MILREFLEYRKIDPDTVSLYADFKNLVDNMELADLDSEDDRADPPYLM